MIGPLQPEGFLSRWRVLRARADRKARPARAVGGLEWRATGLLSAGINLKVSTQVEGPRRGISLTPEVTFSCDLWCSQVHLSATPCPNISCDLCRYLKD